MYDIAIIGGGINGCGIARDAAGRGYSVYLAEKDDLASGTSSGATKLIHGGLRYLEHYEFRLVRKALTEREILWSIAPHIISPLRFVLPHHKGLRPPWLLRLGLFLYDHIGGRKRLPVTSVLDLRSDPAGTPLRPEFTRGFEYSDCRVDDARLVVLNARDAANRGAIIRTRTTITQVRRNGDHWRIKTGNPDGTSPDEVQAKFLVNASGPWSDHVLRDAAGQKDASNIRLVQGSHIVIRRTFPHGRAYIFQNTDGRIFFAIPYENDFTLIGTTDKDYTNNLDDVQISDDEITYLCQAASDYLRTPVTSDEIVWTFSAVRPLYDDGADEAQEATRDYVLEMDGGVGEPGLLNVFGGKLTTYRRLAESAMSLIAEKVTPDGPGRHDSWTGQAPLPGGDFAIDGVETLAAELAATHPYLGPDTALRLVKAYGTIATDILESVTTEENPGIHFGAGLYQREVEHLVRDEWAMTSDDILWRRSKLGLRFSEESAARLAAWLDANRTRVLADAA